MEKLTESYYPADTSQPLFETTVGSCLRSTAARAPDVDALVEGVADQTARRRWTYAELLADAQRVAQALLVHFEPGDHIAVWANNIPEWVLLEYGVALAGMVLVTVNPAYRSKELAYVLTQSRAVGLFHVAHFRGTDMGATVKAVSAKCPDLEHAIDFADWEIFLQTAGNQPLPAVSADDAAQIQYTSGTTGFPKGAILHHRGITNNARFVAERWRLPAGGKWIICMPLFHCAGCVAAILGTLQMAATSVLMQQFEPGLILDLIEKDKADFINLVPTMIVALEEQADFETRDLSSLAGIMVGGSTVPVDMVRRFEENLSTTLSVVYGQTETSPISTQVRVDDTLRDKSETLGIALPHTEIKIVDPQTDNTLPIGETGEFCTRGYLLMHGYFDMPEKTAETIDTDGWLHSGDLCAMDERGYVTIEGRLKDMIIRGGENIYPREIEELLYAHPDIIDVAVIGVSDPKWGEQVAAFARFEAGASVTSQALIAYVREHLAPYKAPNLWVRMEEFPLTGSGKIQKFELRARWEKGELSVNM